MDNNKNKFEVDVITLYINYLHALETYREFGDRYGDTIEIIEMYQEKLEERNIKTLKLK